MRVAIDTSVVYAGLAYPDRPFGQVIGLWYAGTYDIVWTPDVMSEYREVLLDPAYLAHYDNQTDVEEFLALVELCGGQCTPADLELPPIRDVHDRIWLAAAVGGHADYLVTVDPDFFADPVFLRAMRGYGVRITPPYIFLREIVRL